MKYSGNRKLLCELSKLSKLNAFILLGYQTNTDASILAYKFHPERTGFNMYAEYTQLQLTFLALYATAINFPCRGCRERGRGEGGKLEDYTKIGNFKRESDKLKTVILL